MSMMARSWVPSPIFSVLVPGLHAVGHPAIVHGRDFGVEACLHAEGGRGEVAHIYVRPDCVLAV